jgi:hypothetical protein
LFDIRYSLFQNFFLGVLCELCGELLGFLFDQTGSFFAGDWAETFSLSASVS